MRHLRASAISVTATLGAMLLIGCSPGATTTTEKTTTTTTTAPVLPPPVTTFQTTTSTKDLSYYADLQRSDLFSVALSTFSVKTDSISHSVGSF